MKVDVNKLRKYSFGTALAFVVATFLQPGVSHAQNDSLSLESSFRIGNAGVICSAEYSATDERLVSMFDRAYQIVCRDAASAVGTMLVLRNDEDTPLADFVKTQINELQCNEPQDVKIENLGNIAAQECLDTSLSVDRKIYAVQQGGKILMVEGLKGYDSALRLGLLSLFNDRPTEGSVDVATTSLSDPAAFARIRAGELGEGAARKQAYELNNSGNFSESSEFFETLLSRGETNAVRSAEFLANQGLQQSNLGSFPGAEELFDEAEKSVEPDDGVTQRLIRNFRAIHYINQKQPDQALSTLAKPVAVLTEGSVDGDVGNGVIAERLSRQINGANEKLKILGAVGTGLSDEEIAIILDGQASQIRGSALRLQGKYEEAAPALLSAIEMLGSVREGRVNSIAWLMMEARYELGLIAEIQGDQVQASRAFEEAQLFAEQTYPQSPSLLTAKARLAAYFSRQNRTDEALALFEEIVQESEEIPSAAASMKDLLAPYFQLLGNRLAAEKSAGPKLYNAAQLLQRPGVAQTQAVLARELSEGDDEAAALFRLTVSRTRAIARTAADIARLSALPELSEVGQTTLAEAQDSLKNLQQEQTALQSRLGDFAQYRVLTSSRLELEDMQKLLRPGEGYYKISMVEEQAYAQLILPDDLRSVRLSASVSELSAMVADLRDSIVVYENGAPVTYPFDVAKARELYLVLFGELEDEISKIDHLIYEPDGALLQLPPTLLITEQKPVDDYLERILDIDADAFDFTGIDWLGRDKLVSIAVSQRAFADIRNIAPARAKKQYLGLGQNAQPMPAMMSASQSTASGQDRCAWPISTWRNPIASDELYLAQERLGVQGSDVIVEEGFSDSALLQRDDLSDYQIVHFATHGLVTAPRPQCPARPALLTSFGDSGSDGLLSFKEIFDLRLDADLVILSACDTAGLATVAASREAGISSGGNYALDGLVRAFVGAGARSVLASHWPVPDDFDATKTLISGIFSVGESLPVGKSLSQTQHKMMDDPLTSHPFYWAAFILVGDGSKVVIE
ncbi:CHAT domain-containing protein [Parasphingorhabdus sp.]|uniref:CHAT domain-containing protein n=1 Tax=Parasphingorhabdus sp. TaxID=2709688 RepID=UPI003D268897